MIRFHATVERLPERPLTALIALVLVAVLMVFVALQGALDVVADGAVALACVALVVWAAARSRIGSLAESRAVDEPRRRGPPVRAWPDRATVDSGRVPIPLRR